MYKLKPRQSAEESVKSDRVMKRELKGVPCTHTIVQGGTEGGRRPNRKVEAEIVKVVTCAKKKSKNEKRIIRRKKFHGLKQLLLKNCVVEDDNETASLVSAMTPAEADKFRILKDTEKFLATKLFKTINKSLTVTSR
jgi:hypothetical protein